MNRNANWSTEILDIWDEGAQPSIRPRMRFVEGRHHASTDNIDGSTPMAEANPRGAACLTKILSAIRAGHRNSPRMADKPCALYLHVLDDIDFDCQQPFLAEVLGELVSNAVHAMRGQAAPRVDVMATQYRDRLFVQVADNGPGMPAGMSKWFEALASEGARRRGSGLDTAALLISIAGGHLELVSSGPGGTRLGFSVPVMDTRDVGRRV